MDRRNQESIEYLADTQEDREQRTGSFSTPRRWTVYAFLAAIPLAALLLVLEGVGPGITLRRGFRVPLIVVVPAVLIVFAVRWRLDRRRR